MTRQVVQSWMASVLSATILCSSVVAHPPKQPDGGLLGKLLKKKEDSGQKPPAAERNSAEQSEKSSEDGTIYGVHTRKKPSPTPPGGTTSNPPVQASAKPLATRPGDRGVSARYRVVTEPLGQLPARHRNLVVSEDGCHFAYVVQEPSGMVRLFVDGQEGPEYMRIFCLLFSPDGRRLAYAVRRRDGYHVVIDGQEGPACKGMGPARGGMGPIVFSPDGRRIAYAVKKDDGYHVVIEGREGPAYQNVEPPAFSRDGAHVIYEAYDAKGPAFAVIDERECRGIPGTVSLSRDGRRLAYCLTEKRGGRHVIIDGQEGPVYSEIAPFTTPFSSDGARTAYLAEKGDYGRVVVVDGQPGPEYSVILPPQLRNAASQRPGLSADSCPFFTPEGKHVVYIARKQDGYHVVIDDQEGPASRLVPCSFVFSADGNHIAYTYVGTGQDHPPTTVVDGREITGISDLVFSPDGEHLAYVVGPQWHRRVVVDEQEGPEYLQVDELTFSPDGNHMVYRAGAPDLCMVLDGRAGPKYDGGVRSPIFSPDSEHMAYIARKDVRCQVVVVDGEEGPEHEDLLMDRRGHDGELRFTEDGVVAYLVVRDGAVCRIRHIPEQAADMTSAVRR